MAIIDVTGWAWDYKAKQIRKYLSNEFDISIECIRNPGEYITKDEYDLYLSFGLPYVRTMHAVPVMKRITGITNHTYINFQNYLDLLRSVRAVHANSKLLYHELQAISHMPEIYYTPNGVDHNQFPYIRRASRGPKSGFTPGYVGKGTAWKGVEDIIIPACKKAEMKLKAQVAKYNDTNRTPFEDMPRWYGDVDVILIASTADGTPNQLLEGASVGRTVIGNMIGNVPEFVVNDVNGFVVERQIDAYVEKLLWLKENRTTCVEMGLAARETVERGWTWEIMAENYRTMFRECLDV
jgi:glycosyltransferase involved in cell wall biosynthesis